LARAPPFTSARCRRVRGEDRDVERGTVVAIPGLWIGAGRQQTRDLARVVSSGGAVKPGVLLELLEGRRELSRRHARAQGQRGDAKHAADDRRS
jgi:hypothetical protein